uniref:G-protein coupled receptors family 1 profile domain-containing protein n=1 Tax=Globodera rostochiensis TaxID=31243 RepID=A0A914I9V9_GLORO
MIEQTLEYSNQPTQSGNENVPIAIQQLCLTCKLIAVLSYSALSLIAFVGNALILAVFLRFKRLRTPTNMFIAKLAIGDLMVSVFCIPLSYWHVLVFEDQRWVFGAFLCKCFNYLQATAVFLSSWTLVAISFDRFIAIQFAMSPWLKMTRRRALYAILGTWLFSLGMALPLLVVNKLSHSSDGVETCLEQWEHFFSANYVHVQSVWLQYCLPLAVLLITYTAIGCKMWNSGKVPGGESYLPPRASNKLYDKESTTPTSGRYSKARESSICGTLTEGKSVKKLVPMVLLVSALYAVCWLPQNLLMNIFVTYDPAILSHPYILYIWWGSHSVAICHSSVKPFVYYVTNRPHSRSIEVGIWAGRKTDATKTGIGDQTEEIMLAGRNIGTLVGHLHNDCLGGAYINGTAEALYNGGLLGCQAPLRNVVGGGRPAICKANARHGLRDHAGPAPSKSIKERSIISDH